MTVLVEAPRGYEPERRYILEVVLSDWLGLDWQLRSADRGDVRIALAEEPDGRCVVLPDVLFATPREDWLTPRSLPSVRVADGLPVLYGSEQAEVDVFGSAFFMLTRYEELVVADRDRYRALPRRVLDRRAGPASSASRSSMRTSSCSGVPCSAPGPDCGAGRARSR